MFRRDWSTGRLAGITLRLSICPLYSIVDSLLLRPEWVVFFLEISCMFADFVIAGLGGWVGGWVQGGARLDLVGTGSAWSLSLGSIFKFHFHIYFQLGLNVVRFDFDLLLFVRFDFNLI